MKIRSLSAIYQGISYRILIKWHLLRNLYNFCISSYYYKPRVQQRKAEYRRFVKAMNLPELTSQEEQDIKRFWERFGVKPDINCYQYYYHVTGIHDPRFIQDSLFQTRIESYFIDAYLADKMDDKNMYDLYFQGGKGFHLPETIIRRISGSYMDTEYRYISEEEALRRCVEAGSDLVVKRSVNSSGGHSVFVWYKEDEWSKLELTLRNWKDCVVQKFIQQHPFYSAINPTSVNTIRITSAWIKEEIVMISSVLRMGAPESKVDNYSSGGYMCGIGEDGNLRKIGYQSNGKQYLAHPGGFVYEGQHLPGFESCVQVVRDNACRLMKTSRLVAWDFAIGVDEVPILIEVNLGLVHVQFNQTANGPIFGERTEEFLDEILSRPVRLK